MYRVYIGLRVNRLKFKGLGVYGLRFKGLTWSLWFGVEATVHGFCLELRGWGVGHRV